LPKKPAAAYHATDFALPFRGRSQAKIYNWLPLIVLDYDMQVDLDDKYPDLPYQLPYGRKRKKYKKDEEDEDNKRKR
jgi:hypothetical protein|tara:strand:+ start:559 stop:789 length:231 start_codon:yes stop_codon:yes gene_type:complete